MAIPPAELELAWRLLDDLCERRFPLEVRDQVQGGHRTDGNNVLLFERCRSWDRPTEWHELELARFRWIVGRKEWALYWMDRNSRWRRYDDVAQSPQITNLVAEVDRDPTGIFWG